MGRTLKLEQKAADQAVKTLEYTYATNGFVKTMKYPSGLVVTQTQIGAGRTATVAGSNGAAYAGGITYGAGGMMTRAVLNGVGANRLEESRAYNSLGQLTVQDVLKGDSDRKWKVTNDYGETGNNGNLLKQLTDTGTATYGVRYAYDAANRIRGAAEDAANESMLGTQGCSVVGGRWCVKYQVDSFGNAWTENKSGTASGLLPSASSWFDGANRMTGVAYYANGNQKQWVVNDALTRAEFDAEGRTVKAGRTTVAGGTTWDLTQPLVTMTYNGMGQRVRKVVQQNGATVGSTYWVYGLDGEMVAEWETGAVGSGRQFLLSDHLGSTRVRLDGNGEVLQRLDYEPYGVEVQRTGVSGYSGGNDVRVKYTGKERDGETGLDYFGARYFASALGRMTSPDAPFADQHLADPQSWNLYAYGRNSPLVFTDPSGKSVEITNCPNTNECVQAIRDATGSAAAAEQVQVKTKVEQRGWLGRLIGLKPIEHRVIEITGDIQAFRATSENASRLADVVGSTQNVQFALTDTGSPKNITFDIFGGGDIVLRPGGATSRVPSDNFYPAVFVHPGGANYRGDPTSEALGIPPANRAERTAHELLGHIWAEIGRGVPAVLNGQANPLNAAAAVRAENNVRKTQAGRGVKTRH